MTEKRLEDIVQEKILKQTGLFVVKAGPGSGKTLTVAKRLANKITAWENSHRGIATISFTNVAWQEIEKYLSGQFNIKTPISYPHFLGTIDSFVNQYIFLPFGHMVMGCNKRPEFVGPPHNDWEPIGEGYFWGNAECNKNTCKLNDFSYDVGGNITNYSPMSHFVNCESKHKFCTKWKEVLTQKGYATQVDAIYFAMKVLEKYPQIAKALSYRFSMFMIDEAQDTSEIQMRVINLLIENGLKEAMLIGDTDQAIFEWRTANPKIFLNKYEEWQQNSIDLNHNRRSSQKICNFFSRISSFNCPPKAINDRYKDFHFDPEIRGYNEGSYTKIIKFFLELCRNNNIDLGPEDVAILARSNNLLQQLTGDRKKGKQLDPWNDVSSKDMAKAKYWFDSGSYKDAFYLLEKTACAIKKGKTFCSKNEIESAIEEFGFAQWRKETYNLLNLLPKTDLSLGKWEERANEVLKGNQNIISGFQLKIKSDRKQNKYSEMSFGDLFSGKEVRINQDEYTMGTVHSVKGETFESVLLFVKKRGANNQGYENILNSKIEESEELRTIYVAITRPRKILVVAVPEGDAGVWKNKFFGNGEV